MCIRDSDNFMEINATIYCERDAHKGIIIGKHGAMLQTLSLIHISRGECVETADFNQVVYIAHLGHSFRILFAAIATVIL